MVSRAEITGNLDSIVATSGPVFGVGSTIGKRWLTIHSDVIGAIYDPSQAPEEQEFSKVYENGSASGFVR